MNTINYYMCVGKRDIVNCLFILQISYLYMQFFYSMYVHSRNEREREASRFSESFEFKS